jgi:hypothetical protein
MSIPSRISEVTRVNRDRHSTEIVPEPSDDSSVSVSSVVRDLVDIVDVDQKFGVDNFYISITMDIWK